jgi:hypothetical protein
MSANERKLCWQQVNIFYLLYGAIKNKLQTLRKIQYFPDPLSFGKSRSPASKALNKSFSIAATFSKHVRNIEKGGGLVAMCFEVSVGEGIK